MSLGAVVLSGFMNAARLASAASGKPLLEHRILFFGAGSAGIGVAKQLLSFFTLMGMSQEEGKARIYVRELGACGLLCEGPHPISLDH